MMYTRQRRQRHIYVEPITKTLVGWLVTEFWCPSKSITPALEWQFLSTTYCFYYHELSSINLLLARLICNEIFLALIISV